MVNSRAEEDTIGRDLQNLFDYMNDLVIPEDDSGIVALDHAVWKCNIGEVRREVMLWEHELRSERAKGREEGYNEGISKGRIEGSLSGKLEIAKSLFEHGMPKDKIMEVTGLSEDDLDDI